MGDNNSIKHSKANHILDEIETNLFVYAEPDVLLEAPRKLINTTGIKKYDLSKYLALLSNVRYAWEKTKKYEYYFSDFYPPVGRITKIEALNHHIHAYLQDMDTLKNKTETLVNILRGDVGKMASNKKDIKEFFGLANKLIQETFSKISEQRNSHTHEGMRFLDGDLLKAENAENASIQFRSPEAQRFINPIAVVPLLERLIKEKKEGFEAAKARWIGIAQKNLIQSTGFLDAILRGIESPLYQYLKIVPMRDVVPLQK